MAGGSAAAHGAEEVASGIIARAVRGVVRDAEQVTARDATRVAARDAEGAAGRDAERTAGTSAGKSAGRSGPRAADKDLGAARRRHRIRNDSRLPRDGATAERRRLYDEAHGSEPDWSRVTEHYHGPRPADMVRPHGHHIVFKKGRGAMRDVLAQSKAILEKHRVDWYTGPQNLIWAPNQGHSLANARAVLKALQDADAAGGRNEVVAALRHAGRTIFGGQP